MQGRRDVIERTAGGELFEEPQALLGKGERQLGRALKAEDGWSSAALLLSLGGFDAFGHLDDGRQFEQAAQGQFNVKSFADTGENAGGQQGVSAQIEEAGLHTDAWQAQEFGPDGGDDFFDRGPGRNKVFVIGQGRVGSREGFAVDLAVGGEGQALQQHPGGGRHVVRHTFLQPGAQRAGAEWLGGSRHHIGDQALVASVVGAHQHHGFLHGGMGAEQGFDLAQFDAEAANLGLMIGASQKLDVAIVTVTALVAGLVEACTGKGAEGIGNELFGGEVRMVQVAAPDTGAADVNLAGDADGHRLQPAVQDIDLDVGNGATDDDLPAVAGLAFGDGAPGGGLGGAIAVDDAAMLGPALHQFGSAGFSGHHHRTHAGALLRRHHGQGRGRDRKGRDGVLLDEASQVRPRLKFFAGSHKERGAASESEGHLMQRGIEAERGKLQDAGVVVFAIDELLGASQIGQAAMTQQAAFGFAGGTGGEDHVSEILAVY